MDMEMENENIAISSYEDKQHETLDLNKVDRLVEKLKNKVNNPNINIDIAKPIEKKKKDIDKFAYYKRPMGHQDNRRKIGE